MSRVIKFRAWDTLDNKMCIWEVVQNWNFYTVDWEQYKFMQFTEQTYSNKTEVYEGDIYEYNYEYDSDYDGDMPIVKRSQGRGIVKSIFNTREIATAKSEGGTVKYIGNIYQNPELINTED